MTVLTGCMRARRGSAREYYIMFTKGKLIVLFPCRVGEGAAFGIALNFFVLISLYLFSRAVLLLKFCDGFSLFRPCCNFVAYGKMFVNIKLYLP